MDTLKGNHPHFHQLIEDTVEQLDDHLFSHDDTEQEDTAHDRDERRSLWTLELKEINGSWSVEEKEEASQWSGLQRLLCLESERQVLGESKELRRRYFPCSFCPSASDALGFVRGHWGIENRTCPTEDSHQPYQSPPSRGSIKSKRLKAGWKDDVRVSLILHKPPLWSSTDTHSHTEPRRQTPLKVLIHAACSRPRPPRWGVLRGSLPVRSSA